MPSSANVIAQLHRRADAAELAGRIADDSGRPPEILLEKGVEQVLERGGRGVIIFAADYEEAVGAAVQFGQLVERRRRGAGGEFLVHAIEQREIERGGVHQNGMMAALDQRRHDPAAGADAGAVMADRAEQDRDGEAGHRHLI